MRLLQKVQGEHNGGVYQSPVILAKAVIHLEPWIPAFVKMTVSGVIRPFATNWIYDSDCLDQNIMQDDTPGFASVGSRIN